MAAHEPTAPRSARPYPATEYERAAQALAFAAENLIYCVEPTPGEFTKALEREWERFVHEETIQYTTRGSGSCDQFEERSF